MATGRRRPRCPLSGEQPRIRHRERIQALARKPGYHPNPYISTPMRIRRQGRPLKDKPPLGLVCAQPTANGWRDHTAPTIRDMREVAWDRAILRGYRPQEFWLHRDGMSNERFSEVLHARGIQALLISPLAEGDPPPALRWDYFATVCLSVPLPSLAITTVCNDHYFSTLRAVRECHRRGYRRPGLVLRQEHQLRFRWEAGFWWQTRCCRAPGASDVRGDWEKPAPLPWLRREKPDVIITPAAM